MIGIKICLTLLLIIGTMAAEQEVKKEVEQDLLTAGGHHRGYGGHGMFGYEYGLDQDGYGGYGHGGHARGYQRVYNHRGYGYWN